MGMVPESLADCWIGAIEDIALLPFKEMARIAKIGSDREVTTTGLLCKLLTTTAILERIFLKKENALTIQAY
jgi:hypothetical protein